MISYAQNFEDVLLARAFRGRERGFYIDVGAWHPVVDSVTKHFYDLGWNGINIEPATQYATLLERERPRDVNLPLAVGERRETRTFYQFAGSGLSTLSTEPLPEYAALGLSPEKRDLEVVPLREICAAHVHGEIDFLKIDVEGFEGAVLRGADWERYRPRIVLVEAVRPDPRAFLAGESAPLPPQPTWEEWEETLRGEGYEFCYFDGLNRFYLRHEDRDLAAAFRFPPNVYDQFETHAMAEMRAELLDLRARYEALDRERHRLARELGKKT
jgi:FkbM family methyltransferase